MVRNLVGGRAELDFFDGRKLTALPRDRLSTAALQGRKAAQALALATEFGADALLFSCDLDKSSGRVRPAERRRRLAELRANIQRGFDEVKEQIPEASRVMTAVAVPARMVEAWALADRSALAILTRKPHERLDYGRPEELWGDERVPGSNHPKNVWERVGGGTDFADIGAAAAPAVLARECPGSFPPFEKDVQVALEECPAREAVERVGRRDVPRGAPAKRR
ncbi:MAG: hypothetical protein AB1938_06195 [Myxococcota bacterium]